ncbi:MAG: four helix bundle protein [Bacteroidetes bacterium]|nr:MAG: four helix bundle protein [Bacteroidota bacterium]REK05817.1 MAG: four helix bundle protein [Bacteroidota bacterium]REK31879.1 MAG: four helix bundle protein [Bacteroidota bacterium]REK49944.1 MAG: four helix bundle protein [Bacteroidota bacterium]
MEFRKLIVYQKALGLYTELEKEILSKSEMDRALKDQLRSAATSIVLNIAEGSSRFSRADRKNFLVISRGSAFECATIIDIIKSTGSKTFPLIENELMEISKILFKMISNLATKTKS